MGRWPQSGRRGWPICYTAASMLRDTGKWIAMTFAALLALFVVHNIFGTTWSNQCDPGNQQFLLMKNDPITGFSPSGRIFTWENDGPDNSWLCSDASLSLSHVGPDVNAMFDSTRAEMTRNGWSELAPSPDSDFAVYQKDVSGVRIDAIVRKQPLWVEVDMNVPGLHPGEFGFSGS